MNQKFRQLYTPIHDLHLQTYKATVSAWKITVFTWQYWLLITLLFVSIYLWWRWVDKGRLVEIVCFALVGGLPAIIIDATCVNTGLYAYAIPIQPFFSGAVTGFVFPSIIFMLIYQRYSGWREFIIASSLASAVMAFIAEPIYGIVGIMIYYNYKPIYSLFIYLILALGDKYILEKMKRAN